MADRTALVTGGTRGLGQAIAIRLHDAGHQVVVTHSLGNPNSDEWLATQKAQGRTFCAYPVDVADYQSCVDLAARLTAIARAHKNDPAALADALFAVGEIFPPAIAGDAPFRKATTQHLRSLLDRGLTATLTAFLFR